MRQEKNKVKNLQKELLEKELEINKLKKLVVKDPLTGLFNRVGFREEVNRFWEDVSYIKNGGNRRSHCFINNLSVLFIDIDDFKKINDKYGHKIGDQILQYLAGLIDKKIRSIDIAARFGGEELVVALIGASEYDAHKKAEEIRKAAQSRIRIKSLPDFRLTLSIGVASFIKDISLDELIKRADEAMYESKHHKGKNCVVRYSELKKHKK